MLDQLKRLRQFIGETWSELKKTTWPQRSEVYGTTVVVIVTVLLCAFYLWIVDLLLNKGMNAVFKVFG